MKKILPVVLLLGFLILAPNVRADYSSAYQDYVYNYQIYRNAINEFQVAKSTYQTYRTLTAQNEAITKFKTVLKTRDTVMAVYYNLLQEKLNATPAVDDATKNTFNGIKTSEKNWLDAHQTKIDAAGSLDDLNSVSGEFDSRFPQMDLETRQTVGNVLLAKEADLKGQLDSLSGTETQVLAQIRQSGQDTSVWDRGVISARSKLDLYQQKIDDARNIFYPQNNYYNQGIDIFQGQQALSSANQYLRETVSYLLEVIKGITG